MTQQDKPTIQLNLDTMERPAGQKKEEFSFVCAGKRMVMKDPEEIDWQDLVSVADNTSGLFRFALEREDYRLFMQQRMPMWKLNALGDAYNAHYELDLRSPNGRGSRTS